MWTKVIVSLFKPTGFKDTYFVETDDRGKAANIALSQYSGKDLAYLNYVSTDYTWSPNERIGKILKIAGSSNGKTEDTGSTPVASSILKDVS